TFENAKFVDKDLTIPFDETLAIDNKNFCEERLIIFEQRIVYKKLHETYKKALLKILQTNFRSHQLINLLQEFIDNKDNDEHLDLEDEFQEGDNTIDKKNESLALLLQNLK
ncbi:829_t:CDS:2, partial [Funneliformis caledonium]